MLNYNTIFSRLRRTSLLTRWIFLFFIIVLIACFVMSIYFFNTSSIVENNLKEYNEAKVMQVSSEVDSSAIMLATRAANIANTVEERKQLLIDSTEQRMEYIKELAILLEANRDIFGVYLYLSETDEIITGLGSTKEKYFYSAHLDNDAISYEKWKETLVGEKSNCFDFFPFVDMPRDNCSKITYILDLADGKGKVLVALNIDAVTVGDPFLAALMAVDSDNNTYNLYGNVRNEFSLDELLEGTESLKYNKKGDYISCVNSQIAGIKYLVLTESGVLNKDLEKVRSLSVFYVIAFLIAGFMFAYYFSIRQYEPLEKIVDILMSGRRDGAQDKRNEYDKIIENVEKIIEEKKNLDKKVYSGEVYLKERAVSMVLNNRPLTKASSELMPKLEGKVGVVYIMYDEEKAYAFENDFELLQTAVKNIAAEVFSELGDVCLSATELSGTVCMLLYLNDEADSDSLFDVATKVVEVLLQGLGTSADVFLGRITQNENELPEIYKEVKEAAIFCSYSGQVFNATDYAEKSFDSYDYSISTEMGIIACIKRGDYTGAYSIIKKEIDSFLYMHNYPIHIIHCFMVEIAGTILKAVGEIEKENSELSFPPSDNIAKLFSASTIAEMELLLQESLKEVCDFVAESSIGKVSTLCDDIKQFVKENYADTDMNVNSIAEEFSFNPAYLSNMFKRNTGTNLLAYINRVRIDEAKRILLENPDISIEALSEQTGFSNSRSFRRIFQRYENIAPSKFGKA